MSETHPEEESATSVADDLRSKILTILDVYPYVSRAMIQVSLGPAMPPKLWDPVLVSLVNEGTVIVQETNQRNHIGRTLTKSVYFLPKYPFPPVTSEQLKILEDQAGIESVED